MDKSRLTPLSVVKSMLYCPSSTYKLSDPADTLISLYKKRPKVNNSTESGLLPIFLLSLKTLVRQRKAKEKKNVLEAAHGLLKLRIPTTAQPKNNPPPDIFFPNKHYSSKQFFFSNSFNKGKINVYCHHTKKTFSLTCFDHGQYPWGRHKTKGSMALLCKRLITRDACNTCLPLHIIIGLRHQRIISMNDIIDFHSQFVKNMLSCRH